MKRQNRISKLYIQISITVLHMEDALGTYLMLLGRPWLKQAKAHHDWVITL
jgi:hypothetical protein